MIAPNFRPMTGDGPGDRQSPERLLAKRVWRTSEPMTLRDLYHELVSTGVSAHELTVSPGVFVHWYEPETPEEFAQRQREIGAAQARHEAWERETLARLKAKYE